MSAFNGSGTFVISGTGLPYVTATTISSTVANQLNTDLATGLSTTVTKDGQTTPTANLPMGGFKHTGAASANGSGQYIVYGQSSAALTSAILTTPLLGTPTSGVLTNCTGFPGSALAGLFNYLSGLTLSTAGSSSTFGIATGVASDSTNAAIMPLASAYTKTTSAWAVGSGNGALDTGSIATSTWYHVYLIQRSDTGVVDVLVSLSASSPTMPSNYDRKRRIGSMKTNGSSQWTKFSQLGDEFLWDVFVQDASAVNPGVTTAASVTLTVPTGLQVAAIFSVLLSDASAGAAILITPLDVSDQAASGSGALSFYIAAATGSILSPVRTNTSAQVRVRLNFTTTSYWINTRGWIDTRGK